MGFRQATAPGAAEGLSPAIDAPVRTLETQAGTVAVYSAGSGPPVLLIHSVNAAASAFEVGPIFRHLAGAWRVHALDLPGFGLSERRDRPYDVAAFIQGIEAVIDAIRLESGADQVHIVALSLAAEFAARVAVARPSVVRSLVFVTPTGFQTGAGRRRGDPPASGTVPVLERTLRTPGLSKALFRLLVSRPSLRFFLRRTFGGPDVPPDLLDYAHATAHQPRARHAVFSFASGKLFSPDIRSLYEKLEMPVWLAHGSKGAFSDFTEADWIETRPNWSRTVFHCGAFPHFQRPEPFFAALDGFLDGLPDLRANRPDTGLAEARAAGESA
jgi:pimeloyl-ACP methyl ester carboxylesterase